MSSSTHTAATAQSAIQADPNSLEQLEANSRARAARKRTADKLAAVAYPLGTVVILVLLWQLVVQALGVATYLVPSPLNVAEAIGQNWGAIISNAGPTIYETLLGFALSILVGVPLGLAIAMSPLFSRCFYPLLIGTNALPKVAIAPLFIIWFGFGTTPKVLVAFLIAFFPIVINTIIGLSSIEQDKIHLARSMGLSATRTFLKVRLPQALPVIFGGLKVASSLAVIGAIVGEFVGADEGWGKQMLDANANLQTPILFAVFIALTVFSVALFGAVVLVERIAIPWHTSVRGQGDSDA